MRSRSLSDSPEITFHRASTTTLTLPSRPLTSNPQGIITELSCIIFHDSLISWNQWVSLETVSMTSTPAAAANDGNLGRLMVSLYGLWSDGVILWPIKEFGPTSVFSSTLICVLTFYTVEAYAFMTKKFSRPLTTFLLSGDGLLTVLASLWSIIASRPPLRFSYRIRLPPTELVGPPRLCRSAFGEEMNWAMRTTSSKPSKAKSCPNYIPSIRAEFSLSSLGLHTVRISNVYWWEMSRLASISAYRMMILATYLPKREGIFQTSSNSIRVVEIPSNEPETCSNFLAVMTLFMPHLRYKEATGSTLPFTGNRSSLLKSLVKVTNARFSGFAVIIDLTHSSSASNPLSIFCDEISILVYCVLNFCYVMLRGCFFPLCV